MKVNLQFDQSLLCNPCEVSKSLFDSWENKKSLRYAKIQLPSYERSSPNALLVDCVLNETLPSDTVRLAAKTFGVPSWGPAVGSCYFEILEQTPPTLESLILLLNDQLYDKLMQLPQPQQRLKFLNIKYGLRHLCTVVKNGYIVAPTWCMIINCSPHSQGLIDFNKTQIIFYKDNKNLLEATKLCTNPINGLTLCQANHLNVSLECLKFPVHPDLITPSISPIDDDSIFAFADFQTLLSLGITSGTFVKISDGSTSRVVRLFTLVNPNNFQSFTIYTHPRVIAEFPNSYKLTVSKYLKKESEIAIASSVSIARVGSWNQAQKLFQNIILHNLKLFFTSKRRLLHPGDLIPISFDSNLAIMYTEDLNYSLLDTKDDALVWFYVESVNFEEIDDDNESEFIIDPTKTRLITANIIIQRPLKLSRCDYISYYDLDSVFDYDIKNFSYAKKLVDILTSFLTCSDKGISMSTTILLHSPGGNTGKSNLVRFAALKLGFYLLEIDCMSLTTNLGSLESTTKIIGYLRGKAENVLPHARPAIVYLAHLDAILSKADQNQDPEASKVVRTMDIEMGKLLEELTSEYKDTVVIGSVSDVDGISPHVRSHVKFEINVPVPNETQRSSIFQWYLSPYQLHRDLSSKDRPFILGHEVSFSKLALQSAGLTPLDIKTIIQTAKTDCVRNNVKREHIALYEGEPLLIKMENLTYAISKARDEFSVSIGAPKIPNVTWEDIGGMELVKGDIMDTIDMPLKHPELFASGMKKRSGILFYGPPGTGKTLMAKAIASNFSLNFFSVKGPELLNMYIGESEANVRRVFQKARDAKPCVIFFDELDSVAPKRGNQGDSGGVMDRIVSQLLAELDGMGAEGDGVFVIGATNRPDLLDEALLRPGRFDKLLYLGISETNEKQVNILKALTRKFIISKDVDLIELAEQCPFNYTGADFYALCSDAMLNAMTRLAEEIDHKVKKYNELNRMDLSVRHWFDRVCTDEDTKVVVNMTDFLKAQQELSPSVSEEELRHYLKVKANFESS